MPIPTTDSPPQLPREIQEILDTLISSARTAFGDALRSIVLFGSAAEGQLRTTSDVNLMFVLKRFDRAQIDPFRNPLRAAHAAARVEAMFILDSELMATSEAFAVKFADIVRRHRILYGDDCVQSLKVGREAQIQRLKQVLVNLTLRLRERYALVSLREEQLATVIAESAAPLRSAAATLLDLEGHPAASPKEAMEVVAFSLDESCRQALAKISEARQTGALPPGTATPTLFALLDLALAMRSRLERLASHVG